MDNKNELVWVVRAVALDNYVLQVTFNNGRMKLFDCKPLIKEFPAFKRLQDDGVFKNIALDGWTVTWDEGRVDIAPEYLYEKGVAVYDHDDTEAGIVAEAPVPYES